MATFLEQNNNAINVSNLNEIDTVSLTTDDIQGEVTVVTVSKGTTSVTFVSRNKLTTDQVLEILNRANKINGYSIPWDELEAQVVHYWPKM